jgi:selenocysteine-specific elongation factor
VTSHPTWTPARRIGARIRLLAGARALKDGQRVRVFLGTGEVMARVRLPGRELQPGGDVWARLDLEAPLLVRGGDRFVLRFLSPVTTIGGGRVAELDPPRRWSERTVEWSKILDGSRSDALLAAVSLSGRRGLEPPQLSVATGRTGATGNGAYADLPNGVVEAGGRLFLEAHLAGARTAILSELARVHVARRRSAGASLESLRAVVGADYDAALVQRALAGLASEGAVVVRGPAVRLPGHEPELTLEETRRMSDVLGMIEAGGIEPPAIADIRSRLDLERELLHDVLRLLTDRGVVVAITSDLYLSAASESSLRVRARQLLEREGTAGPAAFKGEFRVSRKYLIPLLEHLDRTGLTRRVADGRQLVGRE